MVKNHIPGMVVAVYRGGKAQKVGTYGFAELENRVPVRRESVFEICSITKQFTCAAILLLAEDGKVALDDTLGKFFPDCPATWSAITLRQMMQHTSGVNDDLFSFDSLSLAWPAFFKKVADTKLLPPGEAWEYSNMCYWLLGKVIEKASGKPYYAFLKARIFTPLGMKHTGPNTKAAVVPNRVRGYTWNEKGKANVNADMITDVMGLGAGGLISTVDDLNTWSEALKHGRLLKPASRALMLEPGRLKSGQVAWNSIGEGGYGLGVFLSGTPGHRIEKHSGGWMDASAQLTRFLDDNVTVVVLTNFGGWQERPWAGEMVARHVIKGFRLVKWPVAADPEPERLKMLGEILASVAKKTVPMDRVSDRLGKAIEADIEPYQEAFKVIRPEKMRFVRRIKQGDRRVFLYRLDGKQPQIVAVAFSADGKLDSIDGWGLVE